MWVEDSFKIVARREECREAKGGKEGEMERRRREGMREE